MRLKSILIEYYGKTLSLLFIIILIIVSFSQYNTRKMYEDHISRELTTDFQELVTSISDNNISYGEILNTGTISKSQINSLMTNNELISSTIQKYATLAVEFNMRKEGFQYNQTTLNAQKLALLFLEWDEAIFNLEKEHVISKVQELNSEWNSAIGLFDKNLNYRLTTPSWLELIENIENSTQSYLIENKIENIEVLWLERTKIK